MNIFVHFFFDITQRTNDSQDRFSLYTMLNDIIIELNENYVVENMMAPDEASLFFPIEETIGEIFTELMPDKHAKKIDKLLTSTFKSRNKESTFYNEVFSDEKRWFQADAKYVEFKDKKRYIISVMDITAKTLLEKKLHEQEELFKTIFEQAPVGIAIAKDFNYIGKIK